MSKNLAIVTTSGKAYYKLVSECRKRGLSFISLIPGDPIPLSVKVAITTESERKGLACPNVLTFQPSGDPSSIVDRAFQLIYGKKRYDELVMGIDPGKVFGVALLGDGIVLRTEECMSAEETVRMISDYAKSMTAERKIVKIGDGAPNYRRTLLGLLDEELPRSIEIVSVEETGTTKDAEKTTSMGKGRMNALSAVKISVRIGRKIARKKQLRAR